MKRKLRVLYVTAEIAPYAQAGGLGEVGASLPKALADTGEVEVRRVMPLYKETKGRKRYLKDFPVPMGDGFETCILKTDPDYKDKGIFTWFIGNDRYYYRDSIYSQEDDGFRFFFFCKAVIEMLKNVSWQPDILHLNDWHTGFLPLLARHDLPGVKTVFTIHNVSYHGFIPASLVRGLVSDKELFQLGWPDWLNFMKAAIIYSDRVTTVSPTYSQEIQQAGGSGMEPYLKLKQHGVLGILNGIDTTIYNPSRDGVQPYPYEGKKAQENKRKNRTALRKEYGLPDKDIPLVSMISRLIPEKGIDLVAKALQKMDGDAFQLILMGSGNVYYEGLLAGLAKEYPENLVLIPEYSLDLARKIYGASDIYLMPSRYEPCGIGQLYALRYGAVPVVHPVGGLRDTIVDAGQDPKSANGFYMTEWSSQGLINALEKAVHTYHTPQWAAYINNGMSVDSSWKNRVTDYIKLYREMLHAE
jgi:starch synthase